MRLSDARLRRRETKLIYPNHRPCALQCASNGQVKHWSQLTAGDEWPLQGDYFIGASARFWPIPAR